MYNTAFIPPRPSQMLQWLLWSAHGARRLLPALSLPWQPGLSSTWQLRSSDRPVPALPSRIQWYRLRKLRWRLLWRCHYSQKLSTWVNQESKVNFYHTGVIALVWVTASISIAWSNVINSVLPLMSTSFVLLPKLHHYVWWLGIFSSLLH